MPASKMKKLSSLFRVAVKTTSAASSSARRPSFTSEDAVLKEYVSSLEISSSSPTTPAKRQRFSKSLQPSRESQGSVSDLIFQSLNQSPALRSENSAMQISKEISSILCGGDVDLKSNNSPASEVADVEDSAVKDSGSPWFANLFNKSTSLRRKELSRERKNKWVFKNTQQNRFSRLVKLCAGKLGAETTIQVFSKLGRETGLKEYNALIGICIETANKSEDEDVSLQQIYKAYQLFKSMKEQGLQIEEETFSPFLMYLIEMHMIQEFYFFLDIIKDENPSSLPRLGYYEMLLCIEVNNEEKIQEFCNQIATAEGEERSALHENYLLALCDRDRKEELLRLFEIADINRFSSLNNVASIFKALARLSLESFAVRFILALKACDHGAESMSYFIYQYVTNVTKLAVEDIVLKFKEMHEELDVEPSSSSYEKLVTFCCGSLKVHVALDIVEWMCEAGLTVSTETFNSICQACEESCEFNLVGWIYSLIRVHNLKPNSETFRSMINLKVRMKDFNGAYAMLMDLGRMNVMPTASMYNAIMAGYYREKNIDGALRVLQEMKHANVQPDSQTFGYLIANAEREEDIIKYYEELKSAGVQLTKYVFMALINAYAACGLFEKAKQVVLDKSVPVKYLHEIKSVLVSALASHGKFSEALDIYEEIKQSGFNLEPKAVVYLIEHLQSEGELNRLFQLLGELNDPYYWVDGCCRVILYCVRRKHLSSAVDLLKQLRDKLQDNKLATEALFDEVFSQIAEMEPPDLQIGLDLLQAVKKELMLSPSRKCLDFLLSACVNAKDLHHALSVWKEYQRVGLPYNVLSFLRMYQAYLASGDLQSAASFLNRIPKDDPHVRSVIRACEVTYLKSNTQKTKKKKKNG